jgi:DNA-binding PadR family transcriptional regulator
MMIIQLLETAMMSNQIEGNSLRGHLETMVLSVLEDTEAHGFEVLRRLELAGCGALRMKEGSLYPALYRLEEQGYLTAHWEIGNNDRRGPQRKLYKITRKGKRKLERGRQQWSLFVSVIGGIVGAPA